MDERRFQTIMNLLSLVLVLILAGAFLTVLTVSLSAS
jgi:hypothetical protein